MIYLVPPPVCIFHTTIPQNCDKRAQHLVVDLNLVYKHIWFESYEVSTGGSLGTANAQRLAKLRDLDSECEASCLWSHEILTWGDKDPMDRALIHC